MADEAVQSAGLASSRGSHVGLPCSGDVNGDKCRPVTDYWALGVSGSSGDGVGALGDGPMNAPPSPGARIT